jgi:hypothetical protein
MWVWRDVEDDDLDPTKTESVTFQGEVACKALHAHFEWDRALLREALVPPQLKRLAKERNSGYFEALSNLGLLDKDDLH